MDYLSTIKQPIASDLNDFIALFDDALSHADGLLSQVLSHVRRRAGKRMRPMLILLMAGNFGRISPATLHAAVGLELLHTASLMHDDVVDESGERRGQASVNAEYNNKVAVLAGDYVLSTALLQVNYTKNQAIIASLAELGRTLSNGEILQLSTIQDETISESKYYDVIKQKTAALFEACAEVGALSTGADAEATALAREFGRNIGMIFQIRDDIFDYYDTEEIGKPTGNDMAEGKLTLPVIHALKTTGNEAMMKLARKVRRGTVSHDEIAELVSFTKAHGGIEYADRRMWEIHDRAQSYIEQQVKDAALRAGLNAYLDFVIARNK